MKADDIRLNWDAALESFAEGCMISPIIGWGFSCQDLLVLGCLHQLGKHREKIVDLLEDCNFHTECGLLDNEDYLEYFEEIFKN